VSDREAITLFDFLKITPRDRKKLNRIAKKLMGKQLHQLKIPEKMPESWNPKNLVHFVATYISVDNALLPYAIGGNRDTDNIFDILPRLYKEAKYVHIFGNTGYNDNASNEIHLESVFSAYPSPQWRDITENELRQVLRTIDTEEIKDVIDEITGCGTIYPIDLNGLTIDFECEYLSTNNILSMECYAAKEALKDGLITLNEYYTIFRKYINTNRMLIWRHRISAKKSNFSDITVLSPYCDGATYDQYSDENEQSAQIFSIDLTSRELIFTQPDYEQTKELDGTYEDYEDSAQAYDNLEAFSLAEALKLEK
jgi:hypothetical protein